MEFFQSLFGSDLNSALFVILNLIVIESLLSLDNAAVLATMVMDLPEEQRAKALKYGILGAYVFRGICLIFAGLLVKVVWLKALGGLYLLWLAIKYFKDKAEAEKTIDQSDDEIVSKTNNPIYQKIINKIGPFWSTVILVEIMDLAFSIDNVFAAVAFTNKIGLICIGVFIGILSMRFAAQFFVSLMEKFPFLEQCAFIVIGLLGIKLVLSGSCDMFWKDNTICSSINSHNADLATSLITLSVFIVPVIISNLSKKSEQ